MLIAFIGNDGVGKTTYARIVAGYLGKQGFRCKYVHVDYTKPTKTAARLLDRLLGHSDTVTQNVEQVSYTAKQMTRHPLLKTFLKYLNVADHFLLFNIRLRPYSKSSIVLADRYFYDHIVRFADVGLYSECDVDFLVNHVPRADMIFLLDAEPAVLYNRKRELSVEVLARRRKLYLELAQRLDPKPTIIRTDTECERVVAHQICKLVCETIH